MQFFDAKWVTHIGQSERFYLYVDYSAHFREKAIWSTEKIRRAVVAYQISDKVMKRTGYVTAKGKKLVIPNVISIERSPFKLPTDGSSNHRGLLKDMAIDVLNKELEGHFDSALAIFVFNRTVLPTNECEQYGSMADISEGLLFKSKLGEFPILHYTRENETIAITLDQQTTSCGRAMYRTGIPNV